MSWMRWRGICGVLMTWACCGKSCMALINYFSTDMSSRLTGTVNLTTVSTGQSLVLVVMCVTFAACICTVHICWQLCEVRLIWAYKAFLMDWAIECAESVPHCEQKQLPYSSAVRALAHWDVFSSPAVGWSEAPSLALFHLSRSLSPLYGCRKTTVRKM